MTSRTRIAAAVAAVALAALTSCTIAADDEPRALTVTTTTTTAPATTAVGGTTAVLWFLADGQLVPVALDLPDHMISTVTRVLFDPSAANGNLAGFTSSVPIDTRLVGVDLQDGTLTVNMSEEFDNVVGPSRQQAIAQIVMTATELPGVEQVRFEVDGEPVQVATPTRGDTGTVTACDYRSLLADPINSTQSTIDDDTRERLLRRIADLEETCPAD